MFAHHCGKYSKVKLCYSKVFKVFLNMDVSIKKKRNYLRTSVIFIKFIFYKIILKI